MFCQVLDKLVNRFHPLQPILFCWPDATAGKHYFYFVVDTYCVVDVYSVSVVPDEWMMTGHVQATSVFTTFQYSSPRLQYQIDQGQPDVFSPSVFSACSTSSSCDSRQPCVEIVQPHSHQPLTLRDPPSLLTVYKLRRPLIARCSPLTTPPRHYFFPSDSALPTFARDFIARTHLSKHSGRSIWISL